MVDVRFCNRKNVADNVRELQVVIY